MASQILILDNGGDTIKANWSTEPIPLIVPNYAVKPKREKKLYVADQVSDYVYFTALPLQISIMSAYPLPLA